MVPSRITYDEHSTPKIAWGRPNEKSYELVGLGLTGQYFHPHAGKSTIVMWVEFLDVLRKAVWDRLEDIYGSAEVLNLPRELVVSLPDEWTRGSKDRFLAAIKTSTWNVNETMLIAGSEAAAIHSFQLIVNREGRESIKVEDCFVV
jgi:hypothetical protein